MAVRYATLSSGSGTGKSITVCSWDEMCMRIASNARVPPSEPLIDSGLRNLDYGDRA